MKTSTSLTKNINTFCNEINEMTRNFTDEQLQAAIELMNREFCLVSSTPALQQEFTTLNSSVVQSFDYVVQNQSLTVNLNNNRSYIYHNVPASVVDEFTKAESAGKFFNQNIRTKFDCAEV
jgi:hypothetical protein